ncbi:class I SAM-dependent methyltransferase [Bythopirellula polymerisocia]|uniref:Putative S-adenosylmethionine-dependent methyltransferase n=1 Tax=Bythopirellula polymerisocia TaxID=2528003 RepID=A0A5C6CNN3_9BACT|nr:class I SAM-dependent methyltransferase [Bythopirellula polymerisocia]TWU25715.1 putative S-adenosylmethionine-dependent methyltransferase [Bythopirellula polymerisocia]
MTAEYWDKVADQKNFSHPLNHEVFASLMEPTFRVLDVGCGYGRILEQLRSMGYRNTLGIDSSSSMIARATRENPHLDFRQAEGTRTGEPAGSVDAIILFAVLTSVPGDNDQEQLVQECWRVLRAGGIAYVSDLYLNDDARNIDRYDRGEQEFGVRGVFRLEDGGVMRHHTEARIESLFSDFETIHYEEFLAPTMNGNASKAFQLIGRKP